MESEDKYIGKQVGNYRIEAALNSGAFGRVFRGVHVYLSNRTVAIKLLHQTFLGSQQERESFLQEAQFLEMLKHPYILPIYDVGIDEGFPYLIAEFAPSGSLRDRMKQRKPELLSLDEILQILSQVGQALQYVHEQNIVHRDLKPENILFNAKDDALIADFGIAVFLDTTKTKYVNVLGSPLYMAPEQFDGIASRRSDQYALACIAYELLTGKPPFVAAHAIMIGMKHQTEAPVPPTQHNPDVPSHIEHALLKALSKQREDRYPDIDTFINALLTVSTSALPSKTNEQRLEEGYLLFNAQHYEEALTAFEKAIRYDPDFADAYEGKGATLYSMERMDESIMAYEQAIRINPDYASAYNGRGNALYSLQRYAEALKSYEQAEQLDPTSVDAYVGKGNALYYMGRDNDAIIMYDKAIGLDPKSALAYDGKGWVLWHARRYQEALASFEQAITLDPLNVSSHAGKGKAMYHLGRYSEALLCYEQAVKMEPSDRHYEYKGDALYRLRHYEEALAAYEQSIVLEPGVASSHEGKAWVLLSLQRHQEALASYEYAIKLNPNAAPPYNGKGNVFYELKRYEEALASYQQALQINPSLASAYNGKGNALSCLKRYEEALAAYEQAIHLQPRMGTFHHNRGDVLKQMGRLHEAQSAYEAAKQLGYQG